MTHQTALQKLLIGLLAITAIGCANLSSSEATTDIMAETDLQNIMNWWQGDYNNDEQVESLRADGRPIWQPDQSERGQDFGGHFPVTAHYRTVSLPAFGEHVLYLEETLFGDLEKPYRQRIYTVKLDDETDQLTVKLWYFKDKKAFFGAWKDTARLATLTPDQMSPLPDNCDLVVSRKGNDAYQMKMPKGACVFGSKLFDYQVVVSPNEFWFRDRIVNAESLIVESTAGAFTYHKLIKQ